MNQKDRSEREKEREREIERESGERQAVVYVTVRDVGFVCSVLDQRIATTLTLAKSTAFIMEP